MCEICSKLMIKTPVFNVNFERILHIVLVFPLLTLNKYRWEQGRNNVITLFFLNLTKFSTIDQQ